MFPAPTIAQGESDVRQPKTWLPLFVAGVAFLALFREALTTLAYDWWNDPDAGHGLLLAPVALWLIWRKGLLTERNPQPRFGAILLVSAILMRLVCGLAAEMFTLRLSLLAALAALAVFFLGVRQLLHWWLPISLFVLSIPLPSVVLTSLALPLQLQASQFGAALLEARHVPVQLAGNVIHLPGRSLFVTEACSGLRSLTSLVALGVLIGGLWLRTPWLRIALVLITIPIAMFLNGIRIFLTGFLVHFVNPAWGEGLMHYTEGWALFAVAFALLGVITWGLSRVEGVVGRRWRPT